jgi:subtilisin family serine protease
MPLKIFFLHYDLGTGEIYLICLTDAAIHAIDYAIVNGAKIINSSWGLYNDPPGLLSAISRAQQNGILFIASAGNDSSNNDAHSEYPASYDLDNIISVLMTDYNDKKSERSNYGMYSVDLGAPGGSDSSQSAYNILSTAKEDGDYRYLYHAGTSMAAPLVAGLAALVWGQRPYLDWWQVKTILARSVDVIPDLQNVTRYGGRINAYNALTYSTPILPDPPSGLRSFVYKRDDGWYDIKLTWTDNSDNEEGFIIYRNSGNAFWEIDRVSPNTTEYWDYELPRGYYYYYIRAFNQDGESVKTPQVAAKAMG